MDLPLYIYIIFTLAVSFTLYFLYRAANKSPLFTGILLVWLAIQMIVGLSGFYKVTTTIPPRFLLTIIPPLLAIAVLLLIPTGKKFLDKLNPEWLTYLHTVRIPVEIILYCLFLHKKIPGLMTFEGRNYDILSGVTAPIIAYLGYRKYKLKKATLLIWNFTCLALLFNIVITAILSAPFPFQQLAFDQPNIALLYFPFNWLPAFIVPAVLFSHLVCIRQLLKNKGNKIFIIK